MVIPAEPLEAIEFFSKILVDNKINDEIKEIKVSKGEGETAKPGNDYVTIEFKNEELDPLKLFVKILPPDPMLCKKAVHGKFFVKEAFFYNVFLPDAFKFVKEHHNFNEFQEIQPLESMFPKCYLANSEIIVLEDMFSKGYFMTPSSKPHTFLQSHAVLENLGTFQGVSYAMTQHLGLDQFKEKYAVLVEENIYSDYGKEIYNEIWENILEIALKILQVQKVPGSEETIEFLEKYKGKIFSVLCDVVKPSDEDLVGINHGDLWSGNTFLLHNPEKQIYEGQAFVSMQVSRLGSCILDVSSYMFSCVPEHVHESNWKYLLDVFYETFRDAVQSLSSIEFELEWNALHQPYISKSLYGLFSAIGYLVNRGYLQSVTLENNYEESVEKWMEVNQEIGEKLASEIVSKVQLYKKYFPEQ